MSEIQQVPTVQESNIGGQGGLALLADPHHTRADIKLAGRAVRARWPVSDSAKRVTVARLINVIRKTECGSPSKDGVNMADGPADSNAVSAARVLVAMEAQVQADAHLDDKNERLDAGKLTENHGGRMVIVGVDPNAL